MLIFCYNSEQKLIWGISEFPREQKFNFPTSSHVIDAKATLCLSLVAGEYREVYEPTDGSHLVQYLNPR